MRIRTKLLLSFTALLAASMLSLGLGILFVQGARGRQDMEQSVQVIVNSVRRAAMDALVEKDDLHLVSHVNFLKTQYPALATVHIRWLTAGQKGEDVHLGESPAGSRLSEQTVEVADSMDAGRRVIVSLAIDRDVIEAAVRDGQRRLRKIIVAIFLAGSLVWFAVAFWVAGNITRPIAALSRIAAEIGSGRVGQKLEWRSRDELGDLVKVFNHMSDRLAELDDAKRVFISSVTHELRSPLGAMESFIILMQGQDAGHPDGQAHRDYLARIQGNVTRLSLLVNDLLDAAAIEKGKLSCVLKPAQLGDSAAEACRFFEAKARDQGVELVNGVGSLPEVVADKARIRQVLINLISNALKFTPAGGRIELAAEQFRDGGRRWLEVSVRDTGRGMDEVDRSRLFQPFSQGRNVAGGVQGAVKGTGLGLYICQSIVAQHGGSIEAQSAPGQGTRIAFSLPIAFPGAPAAPAGEGDRNG